MSLNARSALNRCPRFEQLPGVHDPFLRSRGLRLFSTALQLQRQFRSNFDPQLRRRFAHSGQRESVSRCPGAFEERDALVPKMSQMLQGKPAPS